MLLSAIGVSLVLFALNSKLDLFYSPSEMLAADIKPGYRIVEIDSIKREGTKVLFVVTDFKAKIPVSFDGIVPDLFKENSGVVALGSYSEGLFVAEKIFAKHDENYMPPELMNELSS
jgi:cytochrome c-type biogenesis protein CcmE